MGEVAFEAQIQEDLGLEGLQSERDGNVEPGPGIRNDRGIGKVWYRKSQAEKGDSQSSDEEVETSATKERVQAHRPIRTG